MKRLTAILVLTLVTHISGYLIKVPTPPIERPAVGAVHTQWTHIQKLMIPLFENVCEASTNPIIRRLAQEFTFDSSFYTKPEVITNLRQLVSTGLLPKGTIFTEYNPVHMHELEIIYDVLYNAKDFDTFYKAAAWARQNLNCVLYINAIYMVIQSRKDTERLSVPAPYELLPNYFIDKEVIIKAASIFAGEEITSTETIRDEGNSYTLDANYTALFYDNDDDSKLAYFREDVGLNSYYFLRKLKFVSWFNDDINGSFGENMFMMMKQLMSRYNLERYANSLPEIETIKWNSVIDMPYDPQLIYTDGKEFSHRLWSLKISENEDLTLLQTIENNIVSIVSHMRQNGYNKKQILNHLIEILVTGDKSYETLARQLLGKDRTNNGYTSVLEHYMTSLRDPMFWIINKKIVDMIDDALKIIPTYTRNELYFPGVEVVNIDVKKMVTACDFFEFDVTDALKIEDSSSTFKIKIGQPRLNHKQFTVKVNVTSLVAQKGLMKIYLGPKLLPGELAANKNLFTLLDMFEVNLKVGTNIVARSSDNMKHFTEDFMSLNSIRKNVEDAEFGLNSLPLATVQSQTGYPSRLILPKGTPQGLPLQMFVFIAPYFKGNLGDSYTRNSMEFNAAILSPGYPLDLMIEDKQLFSLPNAMVKYVTVTQKSDSKVENYGGPGVTKSWYGKETYDPSTRPTYSKDRPYGRSNDYSNKVNEFNVGTNDIVPGEENRDHYDVVGLNDSPNLLSVSKFDYASKSNSREPFDYKAKKGQFDKKDYSAKRDYTKYRTRPSEEDVVSSTPVYEMATESISSESEEHVGILQGPDMPVVKSILSHIFGVEPLPSPAMLKSGFENKIVKGKDSTKKFDRFDPESLPFPAMLKTGSEEGEKVDYRVKKMERNYNLKAKKMEIDDLVKDAKRKADEKRRLEKLNREATSQTDSNDFDFENKIVKGKDNTNKFDKFDPESLPFPAMLKSGSEEGEKVDYRVKKMERNYNLKAKKMEIDDLVKDAKRKADEKRRLEKLNREAAIKTDDDLDLYSKLVKSKDSINVDKKMKDNHMVEFDKSIETSMGTLNVEKTYYDKEKTKSANKPTKEKTNKQIIKPTDEMTWRKDILGHEDDLHRVVLSKDSTEIDLQKTNDDIDLEKRIIFPHMNHTPKHAIENEPSVYDYLRKFLIQLV